MHFPRMSMEMLIAVVSTVEKQSLTASSKAVGLSVSALSKRIKMAEQILGARIFHATETGLVLTKFGEAFYPEALRALEHAYWAEERSRTQVLLEQHRLLVGRSTYLAPRLLAVLDHVRFEDDTDAHIHHLSGLTGELAEKVLNGALHAAFGFLPLSRPELLARQLYEEPLVACIPIAHPLATRHTFHVQDLARVPLIAVSRVPLPSAHEEIERCLQGLGVQLQIVMEAFTPWEALGYVEQKVGICLLARSSAVMRPGIAIRPLDSHLLVRKSGMFVREDNHHPLLKRFMDMAIEKTAVLRQRPQANA